MPPQNKSDSQQEEDKSDMKSSTSLLSPNNTVETGTTESYFERITKTIPSKYLNSLGFIKYTHKGNLPWNAGSKDDPLLPPEYTAVTNFLGIDCEMVGIGEFQDSELGRVSIINEYGFCVYDTFAEPEVPVTEYRSSKSGIYPEDLINAPFVSAVVTEVARLVKGKVLVGHSIHNDLKVLRLQHHPSVRDTAEYFKVKLGRTRTPALKELTEKYLNIEIQTGEHSSIDDAQATLKLYLSCRQEWEERIQERRTLANLNNTKPSAPIADISEMHIEPRDSDLSVENSSVFIRENVITGAYLSTEEYLDVQFRLLLEDFLRPLRTGVKTVRTRGQKSFHVESLFRGVHITTKGLNASDDSFEVKGQGCLYIPIERNKLVDVDWDVSQLFMNGSLLVLSPDNFKTVKFAIVKGRPKNTDAPRHSVSVFVAFSREGSLVTNSKQDFLVLESKAFYEAYRHTLEYLQTMQLDDFPLKKYIVDAVTVSHYPRYFSTRQQLLDFATFTGTEHSERYASPYQFEDWPPAIDLKMDDSQYEAFQKSLTQELSIIQGPPGTGKTHVGLQILKMMLTNPNFFELPILIIAYTNHALDQTLEHLYKFITDYMCEGDEAKTKNIILRVGGGCKSDIIIPTTLGTNRIMIARKKALEKRHNAIKSMLSHVSELSSSPLELAELLSPGIVNFSNLPLNLLQEVGKNIKAQKALSMWKSCSEKCSSNPLSWFGISDITKNLKPKPLKAGKPLKSIYFFQCVSMTNEISKIRPNLIIRARSFLDDNDTDNFTESQLNHNGNDVPENILIARWAFYLHLIRHLVHTINELILEQLDLEKKLHHMRHIVPLKKRLKLVKVLGMTTTGAVKYKKKIVLGLKPRIMIVEEAAHVLEPHVVASLTQYCEQMILIGDHKQLRPMTADYELSKTYKLDVSLMERLVRNGIDQGNQNYVQLKVQHRMRPEIANLIRPVIYNELHDHSSVHRFPNVKGCPNNMFFVTHDCLEGREKGSASYHNLYEAEFVTGLVKYFVKGGFYTSSKITVIATYSAQKLVIEKMLQPYYKNEENLYKDLKISTVDGYQGEENDIVILSLVRCNQEERVGFLEVNNRVCVCLSRARHGFFMVGNINSLRKASDTWSHIFNYLTARKCIGPTLPLGNSKVLSIPNPMQSQPVAKSGKGIHENEKSPKTCSSKKLHPKNAVLSCGHTQELTFRQRQLPIKEIKCVFVVEKIAVPCGHTQKSPCHLSENLICCYKKVDTLLCGHIHSRKVKCSDRNLIKCTETVDKNLSCGHTVRAHCHMKKKSVKCHHKIPKTLKCGHQQTIFCKQRFEHVQCAKERTETLECGHTYVISCLEPDMKTTKCRTMVELKFECGHINMVECHQKKNYKCSFNIMRSLPCGHKKIVNCHKDLNEIVCNDKIKSKCSHQVTLRCHASQKNGPCSQKCPKLFNCGHQCRFACHEDNLHIHQHYQCQHRCVRRCHSCKTQCPGDHKCYTHCIIENGACISCKFNTLNIH